MSNKNYENNRRRTTKATWSQRRTLTEADTAERSSSESLAEPTDRPIQQIETVERVVNYFAEQLDEAPATPPAPRHSNQMPGGSVEAETERRARIARDIKRFRAEDSSISDSALSLDMNSKSFDFLEGVRVVTSLPEFDISESEGEFKVGNEHDREKEQDKLSKVQSDA